MRARTIAIIGLVALVSVGCKKESQPAPAGDETRARGSSDDTTPPRAGDRGPAGDLARSQKDVAEALEAAKSSASAEPTTPVELGDDNRPTIKLLSAGSEPRRALRLEFVKGTKEHLVLTTNQAVTANGMPAGSIPTVKIMMDVEIVGIEANGDAKYQFSILGSEVVGRPGIPAMVVSNTQQALDAMTGVTGTSYVDDRGFNRDFSVDLPPAMSVQMQTRMVDQVSNMGQTSAPFPLDPVGVGAKWEVHQTLEQRGMTIGQVTTFELVEMNTDTGKMTSKVVQTAGRQTMPPPQPGTTAELLGLKGSGEGRVEYDLNGLVPAAVSTVTIELNMRASRGGQTEDITLMLEQGSEVGLR